MSNEQAEAAFRALSLMAATLARAKQPARKENGVTLSALFVLDQVERSPESCRTDHVRNAGLPENIGSNHLFLQLLEAKLIKPWKPKSSGSSKTRHYKITEPGEKALRAVKTAAASILRDDKFRELQRLLASPELAPF